VSRIVAQTQIAPRLRVDAAATRESARFLSQLIELFLCDGLGLSHEDPEVVRVRLAVVEALTNVARHGYVGKPAGSMTLEMERDRSFLVSSVRDDGVPFDPTRRTPAAPPRPDQPRESGYGLGIIHKVMDELTYAHSAEAGNLLMMRRKLWP
jgi:serine/threonine-protein kinase RsbW